MDENLRRVFDQTRPSPEQKEAMLNRLLESERKVFPVKKLKKLTVIGVAAALMVISCAAAVVTGIDQRLLDYFGASQEQAELLLPGAVPVDVTAEDNGATLHATQVLRDRYNIVVLTDFTAPEGTVLDVERPECSFDGFSFDDEGVLFLNSDEVAVNDKIADSYDFICGWRLLEDGKPKDNHLSLLFYLTIPEGLGEILDVTALRLPAMNMTCINLGRVERPYAGNWSMVVPLPQSCQGYTQQFDQRVGELDGSAIRVKEVYLSPITLKVTLEREEEIAASFWTEEGEQQWTRWAYALRGEQSAGASRAVLTTQDGREIPLEFRDGSADTVNTNQYDYVLRLTQATDVSQFQGGTLTLRVGDGSVDVPLDGLVPAE